MSSGKTTLAKSMADCMDADYISWDDSFLHRERSHWGLKDLALNISSMTKDFALSVEEDKDYVIDNWFVWGLKWRTIDDESLNLLDSLVPHEITLLLVGIKDKVLKHRHDKRPHNGINNKDYYGELKLRQEFIFKRFSNFTHSESIKMGWIEKLLSETKIKPGSDIYPRFHSIERCENFHIHWRNLRLVLNEEEWETYCTAIQKAYQRWRSEGKPSPRQVPDKDDPNKKDTKIAPSYLYSGDVNAVHGELPNELAIEKQVDQHYAKNAVHMHYKSLRVDLSVNEFLVFAEEVAKAAESLKGHMGE
tara:strand:- start:156 stop:1070 length:915 start_codon:yes stop_codon:yes gene_type:complete